MSDVHIHEYYIISFGCYLTCTKVFIICNLVHPIANGQKIALKNKFITVLKGPAKLNSEIDMKLTSEVRDGTPLGFYFFTFCCSIMYLRIHD